MEQGADDEGALARRLLECAPVTIFVVADDGTITWVGGDLERNSGYRSEELIGTNILDHVVVDWNPWAIESVAAATSSPPGIRRPMLFRLIRKDGTTFVAECTANPQRTDPVIGGLAVYARRWDERHLLDLVMEALAANRPVPEVLDLVIDVMGAETLESDGAVLFDLRDGAFTGGAFATGLPLELVEGLEADGAPWSEAVRTQTPVCVPCDALPVELAESALAAGYSWCWTWPVLADGEVVACLVLWHRDDELPDHTCSMRIASLGRFCSLVLERRRSAAALEHAAFHDPLTELANRGVFFDCLQRALDNADDKVEVGVMYIDLDGFKPINDRYGHAAGDQVLRAVAERLTTAVRADDLVARIGGDEFAILCPGADEEGLGVLAERIVLLISQPIALESGSVSVSVSVGASVGVASSLPGQDSVDVLVESADRALYAAKASAGGTWRLAVAADGTL